MEKEQEQKYLKVTVTFRIKSLFHKKELYDGLILSTPEEECEYLLDNFNLETMLEWEHKDFKVEMEPDKG